MNEEKFPSEDKYVPELIFVESPFLDDGLKLNWDGFDVVDVVGKGKGVVATKDLSSGFIFPYGGRVIPKYEAELFCSHSANGNADYLVTVGSNGYLDENPTLMANVPKHPWPGMFCNEPSHSEQANAKIITYNNNEGDLDLNVQSYPYIDQNLPAFVELVLPVKKSEEFLVRY
jgi:hypothetical protein